MEQERVNHVTCTQFPGYVRMETKFASPFQPQASSVGLLLSPHYAYREESSE